MTSSQQDILRTIWLAAYATGEKRIFYETKDSAKRMRMHLYGVYKPLRKNPHRDPELFLAYNECEVCIEAAPDNFIKPFCLVIRRKPADHINALVKEALGQLDLTIPEPQPESAQPSSLEEEGDAFLRSLQEGNE